MISRNNYDYSKHINKLKFYFPEFVSLTKFAGLHYFRFRYYRHGSHNRFNCLDFADRVFCLL